METKLNLISKIAEQDQKCQFSNLVHLLNEANLRECFYKLEKDKASGVDEVTFSEYEENLTDNLADLVRRMKKFSYHPQPVLRVYVPKSNNKLRPLGIPALEDKIVQMGIARILEAIYENDFMDFSYGFRPGRSCHQALNSLDKMIMENPVNHVIDADIKGFFDNVDHDWMVHCLEQRISDKALIRYIVRFLKSGIMEEGKWFDSDQGTPQGGIISPILANIYLHYVLDLWIEECVRPRSRGYVGITRYADDFIICVQYKEEANQILSSLHNRLSKFGLTLSSEKTRIIEYGPYAKVNAKRRGKRPESFSFLGITHFCDKTRKGRFKVGRRTENKKLRAKLVEINQWLKSIRNKVPLREWWPTLCSKLRGHFQYYGVSGNFDRIKQYRYQVIKLAYKWINRRSQKKSFNWRTFNEYMKRFPLPKAKIYHNLYTLQSY